VKPLTQHIALTSIVWMKIKLFTLLLTLRS